MAKELVAMLLAGGQGSRLYALTQKLAKPAVPFGGKYRIIDFPLSNCVNSGIDTVGILTQYQPFVLNEYIGNGQPWDLDRLYGGVHVLPPYQKASGSDWYKGTANAIYQNIAFIERYDPEYVIILSGDQICKQDYSDFLKFHKEKNAEFSVAVMEVPWEDASRFGLMVADDDDKITEFQEKPKNPKSNLASMGIYIFNWKLLRKLLLADMKNPDSHHDFGKDIIPCLLDDNKTLAAYKFKGYWKDVGTLTSYWEANMELIDVVPEFNLYEEYWKIYTKSEILPPQYVAKGGVIERSIVGEGSEIYGQVYNSVIGCGVTIGKDTVVRDSIIMNNTEIGASCELSKAIVAENTKIGDHVRLGVGEEAPNDTAPHIYCDGIVTVGEKSVVPANVSVGKNSVVFGITTADDYPDGYLASGKTLIKAGDKQ